MLQSLRHYGEVHQKLVTCVRHLTTTEVSTALRPFYFNVHPDLFGQYPSQRAINENSLKQLSSIMEMLQAKRWIKPASLQFYLRDKKCEEGTFRLIKIYISERDIREAVLTILRACDLPTEYVDKIPKPPEPKKETVRINTNNIDFSKVNENDPIFGPIVMRQKINEAKEALKLKNWLVKNYQSALEKLEANRPLREEVDRLRKKIAQQWKLTDVRWDCGWNVTHFRGCLQSFMSLAEQHPEVMHVLKDRTLVFAPFTGISLEGHIMLNSGEVRHNWLDLIKNVRSHDKILFRIPGFEKSVSQVLRGIKVGRRKFMPKVLAGEYERNLQQITTSLSDYRGRRGFPKQWPQSLEEFEIVVETEAGPLMVSPTGQFIVPSSLPGFLLVNFITTNLEHAKEKMTEYKNNKYIERSLQKQCMDEFKLFNLGKDDNVTPDLMIKCCERLLEKKIDIEQYLSGIHLNVATYYSVLSDGVVCIPWNWKL
ncbi:T-cell activation inhibitor, mitochondrial [Tribolium madens]|uniref:T-cell activation inhibitor, mitochondrial n=1 Tax=Tribolium madens TaxID=41895 RepID=UPI001CF75BD8|nr:T-cell activation inhibitor, mitochondrial [Tribolium madens]